MHFFIINDLCQLWQYQKGVNFGSKMSITTKFLVNYAKKKAVVVVCNQNKNVMLWDEK